MNTELEVKEVVEFEVLDYVTKDNCYNGVYVGDKWVLYNPIAKRLVNKRGENDSLRGAAYYTSKTWADKANVRLCGGRLEVRQARSLKVAFNGDCMGKLYPVEGLAQVNEPVACEVELPVTTKMADCLLEIADMPCEAIKSTLVNIAKSLRGLEDCQAAKPVDVKPVDVISTDNGSHENDLEWRYIVAGVGTDGHVVYLTNKEKWLFSVDINQAKAFAFGTARVLGRIIGHWVEFKRVDYLPVPNDAGLFEELALSGRPKRRTFEEIKERIAKLVKRLDGDLKEQQNRDLWGQVEGLLYSIGYTTKEAERWAGDNEVSHEFRPRKQLKWRIEELLVEIKSGQNCETVDWNYCGQVKGLRYALMDTPCEAELFVCQAINGGEL